MQGVQLQTDLLKNIPIFRSLSDDLLQAIITDYQGIRDR